MERVERVDYWRFGTPTRVAPLHLCLVNCLHNIYHVHVQNGNAYAGPPSSPVYTSRLILALFRDPQPATCRSGKQPARMVHVPQPLIQLTAPPPVLAPCNEFPRTSASHIAAAGGHGYRYDRKANTINMAMYGYYPCLPLSSPTVCAVSAPTPSPAPYMRTRPPHSHRSAIPLNTLTHSSCPRVRTRDMVYGRFGIRTSPFQMQIQFLMNIYTSSLLQLLHFPFPILVAAAPCFEPVLFTSPPYSNNTPRVFYETQDLQRFAKDPILPYSACPCTQRTKRAMGKGRELDWTKSSATAVDFRAARGAIPAHIPRSFGPRSNGDGNRAPRKPQAPHPSSRAAAT